MALRRKTSLKPRNLNLRDVDESCTTCSETRSTVRTQRSNTSRTRTSSSGKSTPRALTSRLTAPTAASRLENSEEFLADLLKKDCAIECRADPVAQEKVSSALDGLGKLESEVLNALFPTDGRSPESVESIADRLGMSLEEVKGLADNALRGLRGTRGAGTRISTVWN